MRIRPLEKVWRRSRAAARARGGYVASVIMLALVVLFGSLLLSTSRMIRALDQELRLLEQHQQTRLSALSDPPPRPPASSSPLDVPPPGALAAPAATP